MRDYANYLKMVGTRKRVSVKPGDTIPLKGVDITVVTANNEVLAKPLPGAGQLNEFAVGVKPNRLTTGTTPGRSDCSISSASSECSTWQTCSSASSAGSWAPTNLVGTVDLFMVSHHGLKLSNSKMLVHALHPKVAIMNNGPRKGGAPEVFDVLKSSPGMVDIWQAHFSPTAAEKNSPADFIANMTIRVKGKASRSPRSATAPSRSRTCGTVSRRLTSRDAEPAGPAAGFRARRLF